MFACIYCQTIPAIPLKDFAYAFSPLVEETAVNMVVIDIEGCELLFGSAYELANEVANRAARAKEVGGLGCKVNIALASNPDAAIHAARFFKGITFISPGEELTSLGDLPIEALCPELTPKAKVQRPKLKTSSSLSSRQTLDIGQTRLDEKRWQEILETLRLWGIRTFGEFAMLPVTGVSERLGQEGVKLQQLASGKTGRHLKVTTPAPDFENSIELEHPIANLEPLSFILARLLNQLCANLHAYALATNDLRLCLKLENNSAHERKLTLPHPMRDPRVFLRLLLLDAEMHPPLAAITAITLTCQPVKPRVLQSGLFIPLAPEPEKLELTLARLAKLVGADNVGSPELLDTYRPDAFRVKRFGRFNQLKHRVKNSKFEIRNSKSLLGFRVCRPPLRALVQAKRGYPTDISAWSANRSVHGKVIRAAGPWRTTGDWWRVDHWARDEWEVAVETRALIGNGGQRRSPLQILCRIYRDLQEGSWFVEGIYD